jgi:hypothetical protein
LLSTKLPTEVTKFCEYFPQIDIEIAMEHYRQ